MPILQMESFCLANIIKQKNKNSENQEMGNYLQADNTLMFHITTLTISWHVLANVGVMCALYKHTIAGYYAHAIISWLIIIVSLSSSLLYLIPKGIPSPCHKWTEPGCDLFQFPLAMLGSILLVWIALQAFSGIFSRAWQENPKASSMSVIRVKQFHQYSGYFIMYLGKITCFIQWRQFPEIWAPLTAWEVLFLVVYIKKKWFFKSIELTVVDPQVEELKYQVPKIKYLEDLPKGKTGYIIFADYVYDIYPLQTLHPAGYQIVEVVKGREIDRFIYGMYAAEPLPQVPVFSHPENSFKLVGDPIAKIDNPNPYSHMAQLNECFLSYKETVCEKTQIYIVGFTSLNDKEFRYNGYTEITQIGQYFSLTINKKITRLYTTVNCLSMSNRKLMDKLIKKYPLRYSKTEVLPDVIPEMRMKKTSSEYSNKPVSERRMSSTSDAGDQPDIMIPLMIRKYQTGKLTPLLVADEEAQELLISCTRGQGLRLDILQPGRIVIIAGGTGFYPFMDLVDLMYKRKILETGVSSTKETETMKRLDPILEKNDLLKNFTFLFYIALNTPEDFHPMTLYQLHYLCGDDSFRCIFRMKDNKEEFQKHYEKFNMTQERFDKIVLPDVKSVDTCKTFICGPPVMNYAMVQLMQANAIREDRYELV